jgi:hypothetical protein
LNCDTFSNDLFAIFMSRFWPAFWWRDSNILVYLIWRWSPSRKLSDSVQMLCNISELFQKWITLWRVWEWVPSHSTSPDMLQFIVAFWSYNSRCVL